MDTTELYEQLSAAFQDNAYNVDKSRGFTLVGVRGAFVIERLNQVFGLLGTGWRFAHGPFVEHGKEIVTEVVLQYRLPSGPGTGLSGINPYVWSTTMETFVPEKAPNVWSEPVYGVGGNAKGVGSVPVSDAQKSAVSNALGKAASRIGVGIDAYKGNLVVESGNVVLKSDSGSTPADEAEFIKLMLRTILVETPESYDVLAESNPVAAAHRQNLVAQIRTAINASELTEFVSENLQDIVGDKGAKSLEDLSAAQLLLLNSVAKSISVEEVTWKQALEIASGLGDKTWDDALGEYMKKLAEKEDGS